jgi:NitT/TauT family transport system permease protein
LLGDPVALLSDHAAVNPPPRALDASLDRARSRDRARRPVGGLFTADQAIRVLAGLLFCILLAAAWQLMASSVSSPLIPDLRDIGAELQAIVVNGEAVVEIATTLQRIALGFVLAFVLAIAVGLASARNRVARAFFEPALILGLTVPGLVWALLCVIWFGLSLKTAVVAIALGIAPALAISMTHGIDAIDPQLIEAAHVYRLSWRSRLRNLWLPWKVVVLVEVFGLSTGVGYRLNSAFISQNVAAVLAWTIAFAVVVAVIEYGLFQTIERRLVGWKRKANV